MAESLNHWTFVHAAYAVTVLATALLIGASLRAMRRAEARRDRARKA
jgi:heme exporter protein CcmD